MKVVLVTGGFDPLHKGHIEYFNAARQLGDKLVVGVNSDSWLTRKKGRPFMPINERTTVIQNIRSVDHCILFNDDDGTAIEAIKNVKSLYPTADVIFANGGDRTKENIPEMVFDDVEFVFGVGGQSKLNSSSWILEEWKSPKTERPWGYYRVLHDVVGTKVKELTVMPGKGLSMQRHALRAEYWHVTDGQCIVEQQMDNGYTLPPIGLSRHKHIHIPTVGWHRLYNPFDVPCRIVEIQYGISCDESDIERK